MRDADILACPDCRSRIDGSTGRLLCNACARELSESPVYLEGLASGERPFGGDVSNLFRYAWLGGRNLGDFLRWGFRREIAQRLEIAPGTQVLEVMIGDGKMVPYVMKRLVKHEHVQLHGVDRSPWLLGRCANRLRRYGVNARLYLADARRLPFGDDVFDCVYCVGGVDNDLGTGKSQGPEVIEELIRTAKPGARIVIADETERLRRVFIAAVNLWFREKKLHLTADVGLDLVPGDMEERRIEQISRGLEYCITFRKPLKHSAEPAAA